MKITLYVQDVCCHVNKRVYFIQHIRPQQLTISDSMSKSIAAALNWSGNELIKGVLAQNRLSAQCWADGINMCLNAVRTFKRPSAGVSVCIQQVCLVFLWNDRNVNKKSENFEKIKP